MARVVMEHNFQALKKKKLFSKLYFSISRPILNVALTMAPPLRV